MRRRAAAFVKKPGPNGPGFRFAGNGVIRFFALRGPRGVGRLRGERRRKSVDAVFRLRETES